MTLYSSIQLFCYHVSTYHLNACKLDCTRHAHACAHYTNYLQCTPVRVWVRDYYWTLIRKMPYIPKLTLTQANKLLHYIEKTELQQKSCSFATGKKKKEINILIQIWQKEQGALVQVGSVLHSPTRSDRLFFMNSVQEKLLL